MSRMIEHLLKLDQDARARADIVTWEALRAWVDDAELSRIMTDFRDSLATSRDAWQARKDVTRDA